MIFQFPCPPGIAYDLLPNPDQFSHALQPALPPLASRYHEDHPIVPRVVTTGHHHGPGLENQGSHFRQHLRCEKLTISPFRLRRRSRVAAALPARFMKTSPISHWFQETAKYFQSSWRTDNKFGLRWQSAAATPLSNSRRGAMVRACAEKRCRCHRSPNSPTACHATWKNSRISLKR